MLTCALPAAPTAPLVLVATLAPLVLLACAPALAVVVVIAAVNSAVVTAALALVMTLVPMFLTSPALLQNPSILCKVGKSLGSPVCAHAAQELTHPSNTPGCHSACPVEA